MAEPEVTPSAANIVSVAKDEPYPTGTPLVVDLTTEMAAQLVFTLFGLSMMASLLAGGEQAAAAIRPMIFGGTALLIVVILVFFLAQRFAIGLTARIAERMLPKSAAALGNMQAELVRIYAHRGRIVAGFDPSVPFEQIDHRQVWRRTPVRRGVGLQHQPVSCMPRMQELVDEASDAVSAAMGARRAGAAAARR